MVRPTDQEVTAIEKIVYHAHGSQEKEAWPHHGGRGTQEAERQGSNYEQKPPLKFQRKWWR